VPLLASKRAGLGCMLRYFAAVTRPTFSWVELSAAGTSVAWMPGQLRKAQLLYLSRWPFSVSLEKAQEHRFLLDLQRDEKKRTLFCLALLASKSKLTVGFGASKLDQLTNKTCKSSG
jgi:hypothetical protein